MTRGEPVVTLSDIQVTLDGHLALSVSRLTLAPGTSVALMGPNGSGKTTLLRLLSGLVAPSAGTITGTMPSAHVTQHHDQRHWIPITAGEVITMGRYQRRGLWGRINKSDKEIIRRAAERLDVGALLRRPFGDLSGGQQQRVRIAAALAQDAACLLLDEPITGLDLPSQRIILELIDAERADGKLIVISTHHVQEARHCDEVVLLRTSLVTAGAPDDVLQPGPLAEAFGERVLAEDDPTQATAVLVDGHGHHDHPGQDGRSGRSQPNPGVTSQNVTHDASGTGVTRGRVDP
ncbi:MAG: ATP-binding cassette domain-containing protein [Actinobacteria bacterium]|nr:ATP-binding cassette domain-containing protein [Actinomycetota bacterium]MCB9390607.1 ATP-binding cassette domain-containing protein [Acidimicrobiia bacterium]